MVQGVVVQITAKAGRSGQPGGNRLPAANDREAHEDRRGLLLLVLDLGLRERRAAGDAPVHRLVPAVDAAGGEALPEFADDRGLVGVGHRQVGGVPVAENAEPLELGPLDVDEPLGVLPALLAELGGAEFLLLRSERLVDLEFDREAVAVPSRNVWSVISLDTPRLYNNILEYFIERVTHVDMSVGVRRAVVEDVGRLPGAQRTQRLIHTPWTPRIPASRVRAASGRPSSGMSSAAGSTYLCSPSAHSSRDLPAHVKSIVFIS